MSTIIPDEIEGIGKALPSHPPQKKKGWGPWVWFLIIAVILGAWLWQPKEKEIPTQSSESQRRSEVTQLIAELEGKYRAEANWSKSLTGFPLYSIELEKALVRKDGQSIIFTGSVSDIRQDKGKTLLDIEAEYSPAQSPLRFVLECPLSVLDPLLKSKERHRNYIVVAKIESVYKTRFHLDSHGYPSGEDEVETELELTAGDNFLAHGKCLDLHLYP